MNVCDLLGIGTTPNFLTPPANTVLFASDYSCFFMWLGSSSGDHHASAFQSEAILERLLL